MLHGHAALGRDLRDPQAIAIVAPDDMDQGPMVLEAVGFCSTAPVRVLVLEAGT